MFTQNENWIFTIHFMQHRMPFYIINIHYIKYWIILIEGNKNTYISQNNGINHFK